MSHYNSTFCTMCMHCSLTHGNPLHIVLRKKTFEGLTQRERAVAALIARGKSNREIAHVSSILSKLNFTSRTQIAVWAIEKGLANEAV
jgi:DNA-binding NarL/FixJ family response regulator